MVWIVCEDQGLFFPQYGDSTVALPAIEALASEGTVFDHMFAVSPVCSPSRSSILTGVLPTAMGTQHMRAFRKGKGTNPHSGLPFYSAPAPDGIRAFTEHLRQNGVYCTNQSKEDYNFETPPLAWDDSSPVAHWRNRPADAPFFAVFNLFACHESQVWARSSRACAVSAEQVQVPPILPDDPAVRSDLATNYCNLMTVDSLVGLLVAELKEDGVYDQTTIVFTSDHGGPFPGFKRSVSDAGLHVPFLVKWSGGRASQARHGGLFSFLDLAPMALTHFGVEIPTSLPGQAITLESKGHLAVFGAGDRFDSELHRKRSVRTSQWRLTRNDLGAPELSSEIQYRNQMAAMQAIQSRFGQGDWQGRDLSLPLPKWQLFDVSVDPWGQNNLAAMDSGHPALDSLQDLINEAFPQNDDWGQWSEPQMVAHFSETIADQPLTPATLRRNSTGWALFHEDPNVSMGWRCADTPSMAWSMSPILDGLACETIETLVHRIGWPSVVRRETLN